MAARLNDFGVIAAMEPAEPRDVSDRTQGVELRQTCRVKPQ